MMVRITHDRDLRILQAITSQVPHKKKDVNNSQNGRSYVYGETVF